MPTVVERIFEKAKIVIPWYGTPAEGSTDTVVYSLRNVRTYKRLVFKVKVEHIEVAEFGTVKPIDSIPENVPMKFKIYVNERYVAESSEVWVIRVGDLFEIDATNTVLPYITEGNNSIRCALWILFASPVHAGYHVYVTVDMVIEDSPEVSRVGIYFTPSEMISMVLGSLFALIQPFLPFIILFIIVFILIKIII